MFGNAATSPTDPYEDNIAGLIRGSELLPGGQWDHRRDLDNDAASKLMMMLTNSTSAASQSPLQSVLTQSTGPFPFAPNRTSP